MLGNTTLEYENKVSSTRRNVTGLEAVSRGREFLAGRGALGIASIDTADPEPSKVTSDKWPPHEPPCSFGIR